MNAGFTRDRAPVLSLRGRWRNPNLVMDDEGTIAKAFQPDGTVIHAQERNRAYTPEVVPITLSAGSQLDFETACKTTHK